MHGALNKENLDYSYRDLSQRIYPEESNPPEWGTFIHPDELRHVLFVGNSLLITVNGEQLSNIQLKNWIDHNVRVLADKLRHDIYPRLWRSRPVRPNMQGQQHRQIEPYAEWEDVYSPRNPKQVKSISISLRRKPLARLHSWKMVSPYNNGMIYDLTQYAVPHFQHGILEAAYFNRGLYASMPAVPITAYRSNFTFGLMHEIDYTSGYDHASRVPEELKAVVINRMVIDVMSAYGDGIVGGLANSSVSVGVLSESIGTTMSATSSYYGARIAEKQKWEEDWFKTRAPSYRGISFGHL